MNFVDGFTHTTSECKRAFANVDSQFAQAIEVSVALQHLPTMDGAGNEVLFAAPKTRCRRVNQYANVERRMAA